MHILRWKTLQFYVFILLLKDETALITMHWITTNNFLKIKDRFCKKIGFCAVYLHFIKLLSPNRIKAPEIRLWPRLSFTRTVWIIVETIISIYNDLKHLSFGESIKNKITVFESKKQLLLTLEARQFSLIFQIDGTQLFEYSII